MKPLSFLIFLGSFVSFALEPMIGRTLLPAFGGTPSVWVTCLAAFQLLMVGGYFYAERGLRDEGSGIRRAIHVHLGLLLLAAAWCVAVAYAKGPLIGALESLTGVPALNVLVCVVVLAGVTFVLLSANATVVQVLSGGDYRLYAWSNAGSLIGLMAYPLDSYQRTTQNLKALGVEPYVELSYASACQRGWAPAPTNEYQKAIWDKIHAPPSKPLKITYDKDKQKPVVK